MVSLSSGSAGPFSYARKLVGKGLRRLGLRQPARRWRQGLPAGLDPDLFTRIAVDTLGQPVNGASYLHLSPFKAEGGAFRIRGKSEAGVPWTVCFKECRYDAAAAPGLQGHPAVLGPPEYAVYTRANGTLRQMLPTVHHAEELEAGVHYRYILEDVYPRFQKPTRGRDIVRAAGMLPTLQSAVGSWARERGEADLIRFDRDFMRFLASHAEPVLAAHSKTASAPGAGRLKKMLGLLSAREFHEMAEPTGLHGDFNRASILLDAAPADGFRVIDWEWAGVGTAHLDLARLLEKSDEPVVDQAVAAFARQNPALSHQDHWRLYYWASLAVSLLSAGVLAAELLAGGRAPRVDRAAYLASCLARARISYEEIVRPGHHRRD